MKRNKLGASALEVSEICLGTMTWGEQNSEAEAHAQIEWALARGIDFIDTAEMYPIPPNAKTQGATEKILGSWLGKNKAKRESSSSPPRSPGQAGASGSATARTR